MSLEFKKENTPDIVNMVAPASRNKFMISDPDGYSTDKEETKTDTNPWTPDDDKTSVSTRDTAETLSEVFKPSEPRSRSHKPVSNLFNDFEEYMNPNRTNPVVKEEPEPERSYRHNSFRSRSDRSRYTTDDDEKSYRSDNSIRFGSRRREKSSGHRKQPNFRVKELLVQLKDLESRGYIIHDNYDMNSRQEDLEHEVNMGTKYFASMSWQHIAEKCFFAVVWCIEYSTLKFNPLSLQLTGLYNSCIMNKEMISQEISLIIKKWVGDDGEPLPPEIKLGLILCGTILFTHFSNHMAKNMADTITNPTSGGGNMLSQMLGSFGPMLQNMMGNMQTGQPQASAPPSSYGKAPPSPPKTSSDLNDIYNLLMPKGNPPPRPDRVMPPPQATRHISKEIIQRDDITEDSGSEYSVTTLINDTKKRGKPKKKKKTLVLN